MQRVFSRVTGDLPSEILGTLGSTGTADLYFLNPNGIVFGPNARLDVGGSFVASTADAFEFAGLGIYSTRNPEAPSLLLTVLPTALQFGPVLPGEIVAQSRANGFGLQVPNGESLVLLGGPVTVDSGLLVALGGRVEIGAVQQGTVQIAPNGKLSFMVDAALEHVTLENQALAFVTFDGGGDIQITARTIELSESRLDAGIFTGLGNQASQTGDITLSATESISINDGFIFNYVGATAVGRSGSIEIVAPVVETLRGTQIGTPVLGRGDAGSITINASDRVTLSEESANGTLSTIFSEIQQSGSGSGGDIEITTAVLEVLDGVQISALILGRGDVGNITINASESAIFAGEAETGRVSGVYNQISPSGSGSSGNIEINTLALEVLDGAQLSAGTSGRGDAGSVTINASESALFAGETRNGLAVSNATSVVLPGGVGRSGNVEIFTSVLEVLDGAQIGSGTSGEGDAGDVIINASESAIFAGEAINGIAVSGAFSSVEENGVGSGGNVEIVTVVLEVLDGANLVASTRGKGDAGDVIINASESATFIGEGVRGGVRSGAFSSVDESVVGNGGNVEIVTSVLQVMDGAQLSAITDGQGDAGNIILNVSETATFAGGGRRASGAFTTIAENGTGSGGNIELTTSILEVLNGAVLATDTGGRGDAGDIVINARDRATFDGETELTLGGVRVLSGASSLVTESGIGNGGDIEIVTDTLELLDGGTLLASTRGEGNAGNITINSRRNVDLDQGEISTGSSSPAGRGGDIGVTTPLLTLVNQSEISTQTVSSDGGDIALAIDNLLFLADSSLISTEAGTEDAGGDGGDITINTQFLVAAPNENSDIVANAFDGDGGNVNITVTGGIFGIEPRPERTPLNDITASSRNGISGTIAVESPDVDPTEDAAELPTALAAPDVIQSCREAFVQTGSEFVVTGRGGIPQGPLDSASVRLWQDVLPIETEAPSPPEPESTVDPDEVDDAVVPVPIAEAQGWIVNEQGQIMLVAEAPQEATVGQPVTCRG